MPRKEYRRQLWVRSDSSERKYVVSENLNGAWECSCMGWCRHTPRTNCKHILRAIDGEGETLTEAVISRLAGKWGSGE
jgi:hypothetical protein